MLSWRCKQSFTSGDAVLARFSKVESPQVLTEGDNPLVRLVFFQAAMVVLLYQTPSTTWTLPGGRSKPVETMSLLLAVSAGTQLAVQARAKTARLRLKGRIMMEDARAQQCSVSCPGELGVEWNWELKGKGWLLFISRGGAPMSLSWSGTMPWWCWLTGTV